MKKFIPGIAVIASCIIILNSCTLNNGSTTPTQQSALLIAQTSPDAPPLNFTINGNSLDTGLVYGTYSPYIGPINPGTYNLSIIAKGNNAPSDTTVVTVAGNKYYSYFIIDSFNKIKSAFINDVFKAPSGDSIYIRFLNFCPNINEPIDLYDSTHKLNLSATRNFNDQAFNSDYVAFKEEPVGNYILSLKKTISGTTLRTQSFPLTTGGRVYTLFAKGFYGNADTSKGLSIGIIQNYP